MARYLLDADTVSDALRGQGQVGARLLERLPSEIAISSLTLAELGFGAEKRKSAKLRRAIRRFVQEVEVLPFDADAAVRFAVVASGLARRGTPIGVLDTLVAAHALALGLTIVTNNTRHFAQVPGLLVENWL
jgi:tRNA(fMet)-specific endonuclease VapC